MAIRLTSRALPAVLALSVAGFSQTTPPPAAPCPAAGQGQNQAASQAPCTPPASGASKPSPAEQFPFPGEPSKPAGTVDAPGSTKGSAAADHPFPTTPPPRLPGDDSSGSSSSSRSSSSSGSDADTPSDNGGGGPEGTSVHRKLPKVKKVQTDDERVDEDLNIAKFYMGDENFAGAYLRAKDAVKIQPDYSLAHFTLAQAAEKMKKKDEAIAEFKTYVKLDPNGEKIKEAQRALATLQ